jgi:hypothetical protein
MKVNLPAVFIIALMITCYSYVYSYGDSSPAMGVNGLIYQWHFGFPFSYQTLTTEQIPLVENDSTGIMRTVIVYTRYFEFDPVFFLLDWLIWVLPIGGIARLLKREKPDKKIAKDDRTLPSASDHEESS